MPLWLTWFLGFLGPVGDFVIKYMNSRGPPVEVTEAEKAGAAENEAKDVEAANEETQKSADAGASLGPVLSNPTKLQQYEAADRNNRDNSTDSGQA